ATLLLIVLFLPGFRDRYEPAQFSFSSFVSNILLIHSWGFHQLSWNMISWSISAEWFMYLLFPLYITLAHTEKIQNSMVIATLCCSILIAHHSVIYTFSLDGYGGLSRGGMVRVFFEFSLGFFLFKGKSLIKTHYSSQPSNILLYICVLMILFALNFKDLYFLFLPCVSVVIIHLS